MHTTHLKRKFNWKFNFQLNWKQNIDPGKIASKYSLYKRKRKVNCLWPQTITNIVRVFVSYCFFYRFVVSTISICQFFLQDISWLLHFSFSGHSLGPSTYHFISKWLLQFHFARFFFFSSQLYTSDWSFWRNAFNMSLRCL